MSSDQKQQPAARPPNQERIPARLIRFGHGNVSDIPGASGLTTITASTEKNRNRFEIEFVPAWRHFRVVFTPVEKEKEQTVTMVHESKVTSWEPLL